MINNVLYPKRAVSKRPCGQCGIPTSKEEFCSRQCRMINTFKVWKANGSLTNQQSKLPKSIRVGLLDEANWQCTWIREDTGLRCTESRVHSDGRSILQIDHIDGNAENNVYENLRVLCPSCHAMTDSFGARNYGNGRKWRRNNVSMAEK
jgi:endogenous inhibitor of DNA gyrase (YacG/DUF329 family)